MTRDLTERALRDALDREGLVLKPGEEAAVLATARYLLAAARLVREASC